jgi:hypothetical protein
VPGVEGARRAMRDIQTIVAAYTEADFQDASATIRKIMEISDRGDVVEAGDRLAKRLGLPSIAF